MQEKPVERDNEYLVRLLYKRRKEIEEKHMIRQLSEERKKIEGEIEAILVGEKRKRLKRLRELHHMKCPKCGAGLTEIDYNGIKIDRCSSCEGVWLDTGELDAVADMARSAVLDRLFSASIR